MTSLPPLRRIRRRSNAGQKRTLKEFRGPQARVSTHYALCMKVESCEPVVPVRRDCTACCVRPTPEAGPKFTRYLRNLFSKPSINFPSNQTYYTHLIPHPSSLNHPCPHSLQDIPSAYIYSDPENQVRPRTKLNILSLVISLTCFFVIKVQTFLVQQWAC